MRLTLPDGRKVVLTEHAIERWVEYVCPLQSDWWAVGLLQSVVDMVGDLVDVAPVWVDLSDGVQSYLVAGDFALVIVPSSNGHVVTTIIARGMLPVTVRAARNSANARQRQIRAARRHKRDRRTGARAARRGARAPAVDDQRETYTPANRTEGARTWQP